MSEINAIATNNYILQAPPPTATMFTTELEYDGDKISGYAGSAFKAGTDLEFGYDSADNISAINNSALTDASLNNIVQTNSGAWGGSALPISAGPGINIQLTNNMLVFSTVPNETVLWSGAINGNGSTGQLSEDVANFERVGFYVKFNRSTPDSTQFLQYDTSVKQYTLLGGLTNLSTSAGIPFIGMMMLSIDNNNVIKYLNSYQETLTTQNHVAQHEFLGVLNKVVGINRK